MPQWSIAHWKSSLQPVDSSSPLISQLLENLSSAQRNQDALFHFSSTTIYSGRSVFINERSQQTIQIICPIEQNEGQLMKSLFIDRDFLGGSFCAGENVALLQLSLKSKPFCPLAKQQNILIAISPLNKQPSPFSRRTTSITFCSLFFMLTWQSALSKKNFSISSHSASHRNHWSKHFVAFRSNISSSINSHWFSQIVFSVKFPIVWTFHRSIDQRVFSIRSAMKLDVFRSSRFNRREMVSCQPVKSTSGLVYIDISQMGTSTILNHFHRPFNSCFIVENLQSDSFLLSESLQKAFLSRWFSWISGKNHRLSTGELSHFLERGSNISHSTTNFILQSIVFNFS